MPNTTRRRRAHKTDQLLPDAAARCTECCPQCDRQCLGAPRAYANRHTCAELHQWGHRPTPWTPWNG